MAGNWISPLAAPIMWGGTGYERYEGQDNTNPPGQPLPQPPQTQPPQAQPPAAPAAPASPDPSTWTPEQLRAAAAGPALAPQPPAQPPAQSPYAPQRQADGSFAIQLPTGQTYKGASPELAIAAMAEAQIEASRTITQQRQEAERLRNAVAAATGQPGHDPNAPQFDRAVYMELMNVDPIQAQNYLDQHRFGLPNIQEVVPYFVNTFQAGQEFRTAQTVNNFRMNSPDFPGTQEAVNAVMGFMKKNNIAFTAENLTMVHNEMLRARIYAPAPVPPQPGQPQFQAPPAQQPPQPQFNPVNYDPNPQGLYAFGPNGFGSAAPPPPAPAPPAAAPPAYYPAQPQPAYGGPLPPSNYPGIPQPAAPLPMPPPGGSPAPTMPQQLNEDTINAMTPQQIRALMERELR